jgi:hypothetical protein
MPCYAGLDVSQRDTQLCVVDVQGAVLWTGKVATDPDALDRALRAHAQGLVRAVLETGALSNWLATRLLAAGHPIVCIDARAAHGVLKGRSKLVLRPAKRDRGNRPQRCGRPCPSRSDRLVQGGSPEEPRGPAVTVSRETLPPTFPPA